jgi:hypothetical protein
MRQGRHGATFVVTSRDEALAIIQPDIPAAMEGGQD